MEAVDFKGRNLMIAEDQPEYKTLPALYIPEDSGLVVTCWMLSDDDVDEVKRTKRVYLSQMTFNSPLQPVKIATGLDEIITVPSDEPSQSFIDRVPDRVRYYILDWKDNNMDKYIEHYGKRSLRELSALEVIELLVFAYNEDILNINSIR